MADFASWRQESLAAFADEVLAQNKALREENRQLQDDNKMLLAAWRLAVSEKCRAEALAGSQGPALPPQWQGRAPEKVVGYQRLKGPST